VSLVRALLSVTSAMNLVTCSALPLVPTVGLVKIAAVVLIKSGLRLKEEVNVRTELSALLDTIMMKQSMIALLAPILNAQSALLTEPAMNALRIIMLLLMEVVKILALKMV